MEHVLNNGVKIPALGFGVFQIKDHALCKQAVLTALKSGYRLIDTAAAYQNESAVGEAIRESGISREKIFVTTKLWVGEGGYEKAKAAFERSIKRLGLEYVDLYLTHQPWGDFEGSWKALEELYQQGRIKAIGVCNCTPKYIEKVLSFAKVKPVLNQVECHPFLQEKELQALLKKENILLESWAPLAQANSELLSSPVLKEIADAHKKSPVQVILRWHIQEGFVPIPKSSNPERIASNYDVWDFELSEKEMDAVRSLGRNQRLYPSSDDEEWEKDVMSKVYPI